jgi:ABC-type nickel/cobalt efflux system permease component RcnA
MNMAQLLSMALLGFFLGMRHATDPDHVIAVTTVVSRERRVGRAAGIGILWGLGHTVTIFLVGGAILIFDVVIPPRIGLTMEFSVAVMLVLLGVLSLAPLVRSLRSASSRDAAEVHALAHRDFGHGHAHGHGPEGHGHAENATPVAGLDRSFGRLSLYQALRPLAIGVVHGLAGSAAVALLVLATIRDATLGVIYLGVFGIGTIAGMMLITAAIGLPFAYTSRRLSGFNRSLGAASGLSSLGFGFFLIYQIGFVDGLFTGHPHWTPR